MQSCEGIVKKRISMKKVDDTQLGNILISRGSFLSLKN